MGSIMKNTAEMGSGTMTYIPSLVKFASGNQKLTGQDSHIHRQRGHQISQLSFSSKKDKKTKNIHFDETLN
jgi:hypothetical protein